MSPPLSGSKNKASQQEAISKQSLACSSKLKMGQNIPPKRRLTPNGQHGVITQKIELFISNFCLTALLKFSCSKHIPGKDLEIGHENLPPHSFQLYITSVTDV
jgi:hypothetical protein